MSTKIAEQKRARSASPHRTKARNPGGKPRAINDDTLFRWRDSLLSLFVETWGHFGWTLRNATTRPQVVTAFSSADVPSQWTHLVRLFVRETHVAATVADVHRLRRAIAAAQEKAFGLEEKLRPLAEDVRHAQHALQHMIEKRKQGLSVENWDAVLAAHGARLEAYAPVRAEADELDHALTALRLEQDEVEAAVAQDELLSFLDTAKYKFNPRNLAYALAGVPDLGWPYSFRRSGRRTTSSWPSPLYKTFELIGESANTSAPVFVAALRERVRMLPPSPMRQTLSENFFCLRVAVEQTLQESPPPNALPFRVFALYRKVLNRARTAEDQVMASLERIDR